MWKYLKAGARSAGHYLGKLANRLEGKADDVAHAASHGADDAAEAGVRATRREPGFEPTQPGPAPGTIDAPELAIKKTHDARTPLRGAPTPAQPAAPVAPMLPQMGVPASPRAVLTQGVVNGAAGFARNFAQNHPRVAGWASGIAAGAIAGYGAFFAGGKGLQVWEASRPEPGDFMTISAVHYTQGYDFNAKNGSDFADTVELARKNINPQDYTQRYDSKLKTGWVPTGSAKHAYEEAKTDLAASELAKAKPIAAAAEAQANISTARAVETQAGIIKQQAQAAEGAFGSLTGTKPDATPTATRSQAQRDADRKVIEQFAHPEPGRN